MIEERMGYLTPDKGSIKSKYSSKRPPLSSGKIESIFNRTFQTGQKTRADILQNMSMSGPNPFTLLHKEFPIAASNPNEMKDKGVDFGHSITAFNKYGYRITSPMAQSIRSR